MVAQNDKVMIFYQTPRQAMVNEGVRSGTLLFKGQLVANKLIGEAFVFDRRCTSGIGYPVAGEVLSGSGKIILNGQAPNQLDGCTPVQFRPDTLIFSSIN